MRIFWLVVIPVVLLGGTSLTAQESPPGQPRRHARVDSEWAMSQPGQQPPSLGMPTPASSPGTSNTPYAPLHTPPAPGLGLYSTPYSGYPASAPAGSLSPVAPGEAVAAAPAPPVAPGGCAGCGQGCASCDKEGGCEHCLARFKQWLCYRPIKGGCKSKGCCNYNCFLPLYLYFLHECHEGNCHTLPPPCNEKPLACRQGLLKGGKGCCQQQ